MTKPMDWVEFKKWITSLGYRVTTSTKHHVIVDADGHILIHFQ